MGGLRAVDIFILLLVCAISVLIIFFRVRLRRKARDESKKCGGSCGSCRSSCDSAMFRKDPDRK